MDSAGASTLLLLLVVPLVPLVPLCAAELLNNEILEQTDSKPDRANVGQSCPCPSEPQAVLRDISVRLAVLETKMETLEHLRTHVEALQKENQEQSVKTEQLETLNRVQEAELRSLKSRTSVTEKQVETLRRHGEVARVAFSATLLESGSGHTGPFDTEVTLVYRNVFSNVGNAYNKHTGIFTAPLRGVYTFEYYILGSSPAAVVGLVKNGQRVNAAYEHQSGGSGTAANGATLLLEQGDAVYLRLCATYRIYDNGNHYNTFSGRLLLLM